MKFFGFFLMVLLITSCNSQLEYDYAKNIDSCYNDQVENMRSISFFENPLRACYEQNVIGKPFPNYKFRTVKSRSIELDLLDKPFVLMVIDGSYSVGADLGRNLTKLVVKYSKKVDFVVICNRDYKFDKDIKLIAFGEDDIKRTGRTTLIKGVKCAGTPMIYFVSDEMKIVDIQTLEDIMVHENHIYNKYGEISKNSIIQYKMTAFEERIKKLIN